METYDPTDDIRHFRDFRLPWAYVNCAERLFQGSRVQPIAFNPSDRLVLLYVIEDDAPWMILSVFRSDSPDGPYGEFMGSYENIRHFDANAD